MSEKLFTSSGGRIVIDHLSKLLRIEKKHIARIAFAISMAREWNSVPISIDTRWTEFNKYTLAWDETLSLFYRKVIELAYKRKVTEDEFFWNESIFKNHVDSWLEILADLFESTKKDKSRLVIELAKIASPYSIDWKAVLVPQLDINVWFDHAWNDVLIELNNMKKHGNSHLAIMGRPWQWKTQSLLNILAQIREKSGHATNFIFFDYKWDVYNDKTFVERSRAKVIETPKQVIPINPFAFRDWLSDSEFKLSIKQKADSFSTIGRTFWPVQNWRLQDAIYKAFKSMEGTEHEFPDLSDVYGSLMDIYEEEWIKSDTLSNALRDLAEFWLFWKRGKDAEPLNSVVDETLIIDLHALDALKELVVFLVLSKLADDMAEIQWKKWSKMSKDGYREIKTVLVIDEAHNYLKKSNPLLEKIIREWRSAGIAVFFASQSPADYEQENFNFKELLEFSIIFNCWGDTSSRSMQKAFWLNSQMADELERGMSILKPHDAFIRSIGGGLSKIETTPFYKTSQS